MRQKDKQRNSEVMGQCSPAELLDKPLTHGSHPSIHPASQQVMAFVTSWLYEPHPVSHSPGLTATVGAWLTGVTEENVPEVRALSRLLSCDFSSEQYKDTKWKERRAGDLSSEGNAPRRNSIRLSVWDTEMCCIAFSLSSFTSCHLTLLPMGVLLCTVCLWQFETTRRLT